MQSNEDNGKCMIVGFFARKEHCQNYKVDHPLSLEATVRKVQANSEQGVSIFFDVEKAYDST